MSKRFKQLEDTFNLEDAILDNDSETENETEQLDDDISDSVPAEVPQPTEQELKTALKQANDLDVQFSKLSNYDVHDREMDELAQLAIDAHKNLQDLGMNVEIRHAGEIFSSSSQMLKIAVDAKNSKVDKKLRLLKLKLDKLRIDKQNKSEDSVDGTAVKLDRNELLKQLKGLDQ
jgi:RNase P/RNase MRP subunit p29